MGFLGVRLPARRLWILVAVMAVGASLWALPFLAGPRSAFSDAQSTSFSPTSVQLANIGSQATITVATVGVDAGADGFQVNIQHTSAVTVTSPACVGIFSGATVQVPAATAGGTLIACQFFTPGVNVSATTGNVMTFVLTRVAAGNPLITMFIGTPFPTRFVNNAASLGAGQTNTFQVVVGPAPTITTVTANSGSTAGGTNVTITGTNFVAGAGVTFGGTAATNITVVSATSITATTPAKAPGAVDVVVTNPDNQSGTLTNGFTFVAPPTVTTVTPNSGSIAGGTNVTITGTSFANGATVTFGGTAATNVTFVNSTSITATTPAKAAGAVNVVVTNTNTLSGTLSNGFIFFPSTVPVPSVSEWGLIALAVLLAGGLVAMRLRRRQTA